MHIVLQFDLGIFHINTDTARAHRAVEKGVDNGDLSVERFARIRRGSNVDRQAPFQQRKLVLIEVRPDRDNREISDVHQAVAHRDLVSCLHAKLLHDAAERRAEGEGLLRLAALLVSAGARSAIASTASPTLPQIPISMLADVSYKTGPPFIRNENGQIVGFVFVDITSSDIEGYVKAASKRIHDAVQFPPGFYIQWAGQFEYLKSAEERLKIVVPFTLLIILLLIYLNTRRMVKTSIVLLAVPFSLVGAFWFLYLLGYNISVAASAALIPLPALNSTTASSFLLYLYQ